MEIIWTKNPGCSKTHKQVNRAQKGSPPGGLGQEPGIRIRKQTNKHHSRVMFVKRDKS